MERHIPLNRQFSPINNSQEDASQITFFQDWGHVNPKTWSEMDCEFRCVILAEAGAGKTEEFRQHARDLANEGNPAFFIRIEDIEADFYNAFEIGEVDQFQTWLQSTREAWFFLDSVDEARLENPRSFEKAMRRFAKGIAKGAYRAHIYLSSRPYAWRPEEDRRLLDEILFLPAPRLEEDDNEGQRVNPKSALSVHAMNPLDTERIRRFCETRSAIDVNRLLDEIERSNLWGLAERPFDLEGILAKWDRDSALGGRLDLLSHNIDKRLSDDHNSDRAQRQPLNLERAREGVRRLSAAVVLTGQVGINVPDATSVKPGIEAESVLSDWSPQNVRALLERGVFNDIIYGAVRFRHRDVRELLAAEWFDKLLKSGNSRYAVESLFFREQYGEKIITPRLRPILSWLILFDGEIRRKAIEIHPEIAVEGGDPSRLPLLERKRILADIVQRIVSNEDAHSAQENSAIARIANPDLSEETQKLISKFGNNDDAIFFLGRLVWQGEMASCVEPFNDIALDDNRGIYARRVSIRAVMTCGSSEQKQRLWQKINGSNAQIPHDLLVELITKTDPDSQSVEYMLISLGKLPPYKPYKTTGLSYSLREFIRRLSVIGEQLAITHLIDGLHTYLQKPPFVEQRECRVSKEYTWLLNPAIYAIERLIEARNTVVLSNKFISIILMVPPRHYWHDYNLNEQEVNLQTLVPSWPELNDVLYWTRIEQARSANSSESITDDYWAVSWLGHFWNFEAADLPRLLEYIRSRSFLDDRMVALSTAVRIYNQMGRPVNILGNLQDTITDEPVLQKQLDNLLDPPVSEVIRRHEEEHAVYQRKWEEEEEREKKARDTWIASLRANPELVYNPPNLKPGEFTEHQYRLLRELQNRNSTIDHFKFANYQALIPDFGEAVALAYRDAAVNHWQYYLPSLRSEGAQRDGIPYSLIFAMAGLQMEATENPEFLGNLEKEQACHALRYITWEFNGFPSWLERMHQTFPHLVADAVIKELLWELENTDANEPMHYILHNLVYYAPWLHASMAPVILKWAEANPTRINTNRNYCLRILVNGGIVAPRLAELAIQQIAQTDDLDSISWWYALRVDCEPTNGIKEVEEWLSSLDEGMVTHAAEIFITTLMGGRHMEEGGLYFDQFHEAEHLKSLYILMHRYIRANEDINHEGAFTPELRDDAQSARNRLFRLIAERPGKESYTVIRQLINEHPDPNYRSWMMKEAYKRAEEDGDLEPWSAEQVSTFDKSQTITPATHRQLFELAVYRLLDLKNWLERGNDSPWQTWQRANEETEMRNLVAGWLNQQCREQYTTAQEPELANSQRMDIWLHNIKVSSPVPIELKLLDKGWSGPKLCERLRNQLVGDYLREESAGCGVMLLVWQGKKPKKSWVINGKNVRLNELDDAMKRYWQSIADKFPGVVAIEVIVIDLTQRAQVSHS